MINNYEPSLVNDNHNSEGFLDTLPNGDIVNIFRSSTEVGHVSTAGKIVMRKKPFGEKEWTTPITIFDDEYDDRNIHGGITNEGRIVVFFRRYNVGGSPTTVDLNFIYSDDDGETWSSRETIETTMSSPGTHKMIHVPTKGYMQLFIGHRDIEAWFSVDGSVWDKDDMVVVAKSSPYHLNESCATYIGNGKIILLSRDDGRQRNQMYYQLISEDYGETWGDPIRTNITSPHWSPAPCIFYDEDEGDLWVISSDRRSMYEGESAISEERLWIYKNSPNDVFHNPTNYTLLETIPRPYVLFNTRPVNMNFYGYPTYAKKEDGNYLIIITDRANGNPTERADLFQFDLVVNDEIPAVPISHVEEGMLLFKTNEGIKELMMLEKTTGGLKEREIFIGK